MLSAVLRLGVGCGSERAGEGATDEAAEMRLRNEGEKKIREGGRSRQVNVSRPSWSKYVLQSTLGSS